MAESAIEWTQRAWNPVTGCDRVSPGCAHCYAATLAHRLKAMGNPRYQRDGGRSSGPGFGLTLHSDKLGEPLRRLSATTYFVNSMSDLFHERVPDEFIARVFAVMGIAHRHTFQVLTKRAERMRSLLSSWRFCTMLMDEVMAVARERNIPNAFVLADDIYEGSSLPNVWLGVSIENRRYVGRADLLRDTPAAVRFISAEPLLGPLVHVAHTRELTTICDCGQGDPPEHEICLDCGDDLPGCSCDLDLTRIDWLIVGGESGPRARRMDLQWARDLRDACLGRSSCDGHPGAGDTSLQPGPDGASPQPRTRFFFKQVGGVRPGGRLEELPADLRIRETPDRAYPANTPNEQEVALG